MTVLLIMLPYLFLLRFYFGCTVDRSDIKRPICRFKHNNILEFIVRPDGQLRIDYNELLDILFLTKIRIKIFINSADIKKAP